MLVQQYAPLPQSLGWVHVKIPTGLSARETSAAWASFEVEHAPAPFAQMQ